MNEISNSKERLLRFLDNLIDPSGKFEPFDVITIRCQRCNAMDIVMVDEVAANEHQEKERIVNGTLEKKSITRQSFSLVLIDLFEACTCPTLSLASPAVHPTLEETP